MKVYSVQLRSLNLGMMLLRRKTYASDTSRCPSTFFLPSDHQASTRPSQIGMSCQFPTPSFTDSLLLTILLRVCLVVILSMAFIHREPSLLMLDIPIPSDYYLHSHHSF